MTTADPAAPPAPALAAPRPPSRPLSPLRFMQTLRANSIATYPEEAFERDFVERRLWSRRYLVVNAPDGVKRVLLDNVANYPKSPLARALVEPGLGRGLLTSEGEMWRRHRRIMAPAFHPRRLAAMVPSMAELARRMLARWDALPRGVPIDAAAEMMHLTLEIIARAMFSADAADDVAVVEDSVNRYQATVRPGVLDMLGLPEWLPRQRGRRAGRALAGMDRVIDRLMAERQGRAGPPGEDLLSMLLTGRDERTGDGLTPREVRDEVVTIFTAGHETTAQALAWIWYLLSLHPAEEASLHAEVDRVLGGRAPGAEDLVRLPWTRQVVEEALRLYPPVHAVSRQALSDDVILGRRVAKGTIVLISPWVLHRHRRLWVEPERFDPGRFAPAASAARPRFAYLPFGAGPRVCIGASLAMTEAILIVAMVAQRYRLRLVPGHLVEPVGLITLRPRGGLPVILERRVPGGA